MAKTSKAKYTCFYCEKEYVDTNFYKSYNRFYSNIGKIPYCKQCIEKLYQQYYEEYTNEGCLTPERNAVKRLCMALGIYYREDVFNAATVDKKKRSINISPMGAYMKMIQLSQYKNKSYDTTLTEEAKDEFIANTSNGVLINTTVDQETKDFFGHGFTDDDYNFLKREYDDWTARHECQTKAQEEVFKRICFKQLEILKATRRGEDTKNLDATFQNYLDTAKLQPKQNAGETTAENQTFGTLIDKWENTRPIPEVDEDLRDVDKIGLYLEIFFKGHLAKMMGMKNGLSNLYSKFMQKYTVERPEYNDDEDGEALFDAIFGNANMDDD